MLQYTQCADPSESAARKERFRKAEEEGQLEEEVARMVRAQKPTTEFSLRVTPPAPPPMVEEQLSAERIPAVLRLGPPATPMAEATVTLQEPATKCKPGRPPGIKKQHASQVSPKLIKGSCSRKRKTQVIKPPLPRRKVNNVAGKVRTPKPKRAGTSRGPRDSRGTTSSTTNSENQPLCNLIPTATKRRMD